MSGSMPDAQHAVRVIEPEPPSASKTTFSTAPPCTWTLRLWAPGFLSWKGRSLSAAFRGFSAACDSDC